MKNSYDKVRDTCAVHISSQDNLKLVNAYISFSCVILFYNNNYTDNVYRYKIRMLRI